MRQVTRSALPAMLAMSAAILTACGGGEEKQARADANAAGFVPPSVTSRLDFGGSAERRFRTLDRNADDALTPDELPRRNAAPTMALDRNKDGKVSAIEWSEGMLARFDRMDINHDGAVTTDERGATRTPAP